MSKVWVILLLSFSLPALGKTSELEKRTSKFNKASKEERAQILDYVVSEFSSFKGKDKKLVADFISFYIDNFRENVKLFTNKEKTKLSSVFLSHTAFFIEDLKATRMKMSKDYYNTPFVKRVCPYLTLLGHLESRLKGERKKKFLKNKGRKQFLEEVLRLYGALYGPRFNEGSHNHMYCLYNNYKKPWPEEIKILSQILTKKERLAIKENMKICHEETLEGNGDGFSATKEPSKTSPSNKKSPKPKAKPVRK